MTFPPLYSLSGVCTHFLHPQSFPIDLLGFRCSLLMSCRKHRLLREAILMTLFKTTLPPLPNYFRPQIICFSLSSKKETNKMQPSAHHLGCTISMYTLMAGAALSCPWCMAHITSQSNICWLSEFKKLRAVGMLRACQQPACPPNSKGN